MGTRGTWGYAVGGELKLTYNHNDSYPDGLGINVLNHARKLARDAEARAQVGSLRLVDEDDEPTAEDITRLRGLARTVVGSRRIDDWYVLLREAQGEPDATLKAGVMIDNKDFARDGLFCEYGYVIDLDADTFEAYVGFAKEPHTEGRFASLGGASAGYQPIKLVASWPLSALPSNADLIAAFEGDAE